MLNTLAYANSGPVGVAVLEALFGAPSTSTDRRPQFIPLRRTIANGRWDGPLAEVTVTHVYSYARSEYAKTIEAVYRFPLPGDSAVRRVVVTFGDVEISAELNERQQAEAEYVEARQRGQQAALVTRESPDVFSLHLTGLQPDEEIVIETTYVQSCDADGTGWALRIPLTTAPRYVRGDELGTGAERAQPLCVFRDPGHRFALDILASSAGTVECNTHDIDLTDEDGQLRIQLAEGEVIPDRDCTLVWHPTADADRPSLLVLLGEDRNAGQSYFLAHLSPPTSLPSDAVVPLEAIVLVDHSGSMSGSKWEAADRAAVKFVGGLAEHDQYNIGVFDTSQRWLSRHPMAVGTDAAASVSRFLQAARDGGGTELGVALEQALSQRRIGADRSRQVVLITDTQVSDFGRILRLVDQEARRPDRRRINVLCIDAAPNSFLVREIARRSGGIARFLTSRPDEGDIEATLRQILDGLRQPVLTGLRLEVNRPTVEVAERTSASASQPGWSAIDLGDLTVGRSTWLVGRVPSAEAATLSFRLVGASERPVDCGSILTRSTNSGTLKALFGAWRVLGLEGLSTSHHTEGELRDELARLGYDLEKLPESGAKPIYEENVRERHRQLLADLLLREALDYGLLSSVTGFVAVRKEQGERVSETVIIGNALPDEWSDGLAQPIIHYRAAPTSWCANQAPMESMLRHIRAREEYEVPSVAPQDGSARRLDELQRLRGRLARQLAKVSQRRKDIEARILELRERQRRLREMMEQVAFEIRPFWLRIGETLYRARQVCEDGMGAGEFTGGSNADNLVDAQIRAIHALKAMLGEVDPQLDSILAKLTHASKEMDERQDVSSELLHLEAETKDCHREQTELTQRLAEIERDISQDES